MKAAPLSAEVTHDVQPTSNRDDGDWLAKPWRESRLVMNNIGEGTDDDLQGGCCHDFDQIRFYSIRLRLTGD